MQQNDWRLTNQMSYLYRKTFKKSVFKSTPTHDHEHCEFCFDKFGEGEGFLKSGYCTQDGYHWVCNECFSDFQEKFEWIILEADQ